jgi:hypothetical protein
VGEIPRSQAGCQKPKTDVVLADGEQARGPQHKVKSAASLEKQSESRAAHVTAKATFTALHPDGALSFGGVWDVARVQRVVRNRRGPSDVSSSRQVEPYKPKVKSVAGQRESEGIIVLMTFVQQNADRGKGPYFGYVERGSTCEGMTIWSNYLRCQRMPVKARQYQSRLGAAAKFRSWNLARAIRPRCRDTHFDARDENVQRRDVTPCIKSPSVSRVRENRTHGLNGGPTGIFSKRKGR